MAHHPKCSKCIKRHRKNDLCYKKCNFIDCDYDGIEGQPIGTADASHVCQTVRLFKSKMLVQCILPCIS
jgi:hypothetical protein